MEKSPNNSKGTQTLQQNRRALVEKIIKNMDQGYVPLQRRWASFGRPFNPVSHCNYKAGNFIRLKIAADSAGYTDNRWCTYKQAEKQGWHIRKGEKGTLLEKWIFEEEKLVTDPDTGKTTKEKVQLSPPKCNYFYVFNGEQIDGIPENPALHNLQIEPGSEKNLEIADKLIASSVCAVHEEQGDRAFYRPTEDAVHIPLREQFRNPESFTATLLHEMSHSTGAPGRLDRDLSGVFGSDSYAKEELRAEIASAMLASDIGIPPSAELLQDNSNYLLSWIRVLNDDPNELFRAARDAEKAADFVLDHYNLYLEQQLQQNPEKYMQEHLSNEEVIDNTYENSIPSEKESGQPVHHGRRYNESGDRLWNGKSVDQFSKLDAVQFLVENEIKLSGSLSDEFLNNLRRNGFDYQNGTVTEINTSDKSAGTHTSVESRSSPAKNDDIRRISRELKRMGCDPNKQLIKNIAKLEQTSGKQYSASDLGKLSPNNFQNPEERKLALVINDQIQAILPIH